MHLWSLPRAWTRGASALVFLPCLAAQSDRVLTVAPPPKALAKRGSALESRVRVELRGGYHVNSNTPSDDYLIPLRLAWDAAPLKVAAVVYPKPRMEKYEFWAKPLSVFTGDLDILTRFEVPATATRGPHILIGKLRYQACSTKACLPPKTAEVRLSIDVR